MQCCQSFSQLIADLEQRGVRILSITNDNDQKVEDLEDLLTGEYTIEVAADEDWDKAKIDIRALYKEVNIITEGDVSFLEVLIEDDKIV